MNPAIVSKQMTLKSNAEREKQVAEECIQHDFIDKKGKKSAKLNNVLFRDDHIDSNTH